MSLYLDNVVRTFTKGFIKNTMLRICEEESIELLLSKSFTNYENNSWSKQTSYSTDSWIGVGVYDDIELAFISFFHELGHIQLIRFQRENMIDVAAPSMFQLELQATYHGLRYAHHNDIFFSDRAVRWLNIQSVSYAEFQGQRATHNSVSEDVYDVRIN